MALTPMNIFIAGFACSIIMLLALIPAGMAEGRGRSFVRWYLYSLALFPFAMFHAIIIYEKPTEEIRHLRTTIIEYLSQSPRYNEIFGRHRYWDEVMVRSYGEVNSNCPVDAVSVSIRFSLENNGYRGRLDFINVSDKTLIGVKCVLTFRYLTPSGLQESSASTTEWLIQNRPAGAGEVFSSDYSVPLSGIHLNNKSELQLVVENVIFSDETIWTNYNNRGLFTFYYDADKSREISNLRVLAGDDAVSYASQIADHWICVCGSVNRSDQEACKHCGRQQALTLVEFADLDKVRERLKIYVHLSSQLERAAIPMIFEGIPEPPAANHSRRRKEIIVIMILIILLTDMMLGIHAGLSSDYVKFFADSFGQIGHTIAGLL